MKKSKTFFACAMLAALASCSNDHVLSQQSPTPSDPDVINIVAASSKPATRAVENATNLQNTQFATGEKINVYLGENVTSSTTSYDLYRYKVTNTAPSGGSGKVLELNTTDYSTQTAPHYPITGNGMDAYALYPALGSSEAAYEITDQTRTFSVAENQKDDADYRKSDLMFGTNNWDPGNSGAPYNPFLGTKKPNPVMLYFKHVLSKIIVKLLPGDGMSDATLKGATIKLKNTSIKANITKIENPGGITFSADNSGSEIKDITLTDNYAGSESSFSSSTYSGCAGIIIPQDITVPSPTDTQTPFIEIILSPSNAKYVYNIADGDGNPNSIMEFKSGYSYTYTITLSAGNVIVVSTQIAPWQDKPISGNADLQ